MPQQFATAGEFEAAVQSHLDPDNQSAEVAYALRAGISAAENAIKTEPALPGDTALNIKLGGFVIRDADVPFLQALSAVSIAVAAAASTGGLTAPLIVAAVTSLGQLCWSVWRKGVRLDEIQLLILGLLRAQGPLQMDDLTAELRRQRPDVSAAAVERTLKALKDVELSDGQIISLAASDEDGAWRARQI